MATPKPITLDGRIYTFDRAIETVISADYVPDWSLAKAVKESVQNQLDECLQAGTLPHIALGNPAQGESVILTDGGRGVDLAQILLLGQSGKRGDSETVGEHGEGEIISTLVCARKGITKLMASREWLFVGKLAPTTHGLTTNVLWLNVYKTANPRKGTMWFYCGASVAQAAARAYIDFRRHHAFTKATAYNAVAQQLIAFGVDMPAHDKTFAYPVIPNERGRLYSRGQLVNTEVWGLALGYNLATSPGRDRNGFNVDSVLPEVAALFAAHAGAEAVYTVLEYARGYAQRPFEWLFPNGPTNDQIKRGISMFLRTRNLRAVCWADPNVKADAPLVADAKLTKDVCCLNVGEPAAWLKDVLPHVSKVITPQVRNALLIPFAAPVNTALTTLLRLLGQPNIPCEGRTLDAWTDGMGSATRITLDPAKIKTWSWERFVEVVLHEAAHVASGGASDCTRQHANAITSLSVKLAQAIAADPQSYVNVREVYSRWQAGA